MMIEYEQRYDLDEVDISKSYSVWLVTIWKVLKAVILLIDTEYLALSNIEQDSVFTIIIINCLIVTSANSAEGEVIVVSIIFV